jgi:hypothetical protein
MEHAGMPARINDAPGINMTKIDAMFIHVFVRRAGVGATPFTWEIHGSGITPIHVSLARYGSMHAAYEAGQAGLAALTAAAMRKLPTERAVTNEAQELAA